MGVSSLQANLNREGVLGSTDLKVCLVGSAAGRGVSVVLQIHLVAVVLPLGSSLQFDGPELGQVPLALCVEADEAGAVWLRVEQREQHRSLEARRLLWIA